MTGKTHIIVGTTAAAATLYFTHTNDINLLFLAGAAIGSLIPDIDHPQSKINKINPIMWIIGGIYRILIKAVANIVNLIGKGINFPQLSGGHRGPLTHGLIGVGIFALMFSPIITYSSMLYFGIMLGIISHLVADMFNPQGVPILYPIIKGHQRILPKFIAPTTGTGGEKIFQIFVIMGGIFTISQMPLMNLHFIY